MGWISHSIADSILFLFLDWILNLCLVIMIPLNFYWIVCPSWSFHECIWIEFCSKFGLEYGHIRFMKLLNLNLWSIDVIWLDWKTPNWIKVPMIHVGLHLPMIHWPFKLDLIWELGWITLKYSSVKFSSSICSACMYLGYVLSWYESQNRDPPLCFKVKRRLSTMCSVWLRSKWC